MKEKKNVFRQEYVTGYKEITDSYIDFFSGMLDIGDYTPPEVVECMYKTLSKQFIKDMKKGKKVIKYNIRCDISNERMAQKEKEKEERKAKRKEKRVAFKQRLKNIFNRKKKSNTSTEEIQEM